MATQTIVILGGTGTVQGDTAASSNTVALRDSSANLTVAGLAASGNLSIGGGITATQGIITSGATVPNTVTVVLLDATSASFNATLPALSVSSGQAYLFIRTDSSGNLPTLKGNASETLNHAGTAANTYTGLSAQGKMVLVVADTTHSTWWVGLFT